MIKIIKRFYTFSIILFFITLLSSCKCEIKNNFIAVDKPICRVNLFTSTGAYEKHFLLMNLGHAFITFENLSEKTLVVGEYSLGVDEEISVSIWPISGHFSVWYNIESEMINTSNKYGDRISISFEIDEILLNEISDFIITNPKWGLFYNCSKFVLEIYNIITKNNYVTTLTTPKVLSNIFTQYKFTSQKLIKENSNIGYFKEGEYIRCELKY